MDAIQIPVAAQPIDVTVNVPGSKSITNRALLVAALADGRSVLQNALFSDDTHWLAACLAQLGIPVVAVPERSRFEIVGQGGRIPNQQADLFVGNAGTAARFITALVSLGQGTYRIDGLPRMRERPMGDLLAVLEAAETELAFEGVPGHIPFTIRSQGFPGGAVSLEASQTSQQLSALLMIAPYARKDTVITLASAPVFRPYIEMTGQVMAAFGVSAPKLEGSVIQIRAAQQYQPREYFVEPDASNASYFFAAAAITGGRVRVDGLSRQSLQGDIGFVDVLAAMGCEVAATDSYVEVKGPAQLRGVEVDLQHTSDMVQTLAAIAPFADSPVAIRNVEHIRWKETDRIQALVTELRRLGGKVDERRDGLKIYPGTLKGAPIETYDDHRMAMAFAVTGLRVPGLVIKNPACTSKTFPDFFERFFRMLGSQRPSI